ncbi:MAG TPA: hypothetical protein VNW92_08395 [Polyangiaceae bacterium]|jgi:hypothetical protein|nr:hypothetical protein [Polyangiaceae bacterium]
MTSPRILGILAVFTACSAAPAKTPSQAGGRQPVASGPHFPDAKAERVRSRSLDFPVELMLPEKARWRITDGPSWLEAEQLESSSRFAWRTWRAERLVRRSDCAAQARLVRPTIPSASDESVVDQRPFAAPPGFDSELVVGVEPTKLGVSGYAIVFGASVGYCYAAVFTTTASGAGAEQEVATRLGVAVDRVLSSVRTRSIDERAVRRRLVVTPKAAGEEPK